jgi:hypothetical protein
MDLHRPASRPNVRVNLEKKHWRLAHSIFACIARKHIECDGMSTRAGPLETEKAAAFRAGLAHYAAHGAPVAPRDHRTVLTAWDLGLGCSAEAASAAAAALLAGSKVRTDCGLDPERSFWEARRLRLRKSFKAGANLEVPEKDVSPRGDSKDEGSSGSSYPDLGDCYVVIPGNPSVPTALAPKYRPGLAFGGLVPVDSGLPNQYEIGSPRPVSEATLDSVYIDDWGVCVVAPGEGVAGLVEAGTFPSTLTTKSGALTDSEVPKTAREQEREAERSRQSALIKELEAARGALEKAEEERKAGAQRAQEYSAEPQEEVIQRLQEAARREWEGEERARVAATLAYREQYLAEAEAAKARARQEAEERAALFRRAEDVAKARVEAEAAGRAIAAEAARSRFREEQVRREELLQRGAEVATKARTPLLPPPQPTAQAPGSGSDGRGRFRNRCSGCGQDRPDHPGGQCPGPRAGHRIAGPGPLPPTPTPPTQWNAAGHALDRVQAAERGQPEPRIHLGTQQGNRTKLFLLYAGVPKTDFGLWRGAWREVLSRWGHVSTGKGFELHEEREARTWGRGLPHSGDWVDRVIRDL